MRAENDAEMRTFAAHDVARIDERLASLRGQTIVRVTYLCGAQGSLLVVLGWHAHQTQELELETASGERVNICWAVPGYNEGLLVASRRFHTPAVTVDPRETRLWADLVDLPIVSAKVHRHVTGQEHEVTAPFAVTLDWGERGSRLIALGEVVDADENIGYMPDSLVVLDDERSGKYLASSPALVR